MRKLRLRRSAPLVVAAIAVCAFSAVAGCGGEQAGGRIKVAVSIVPLADFARNVGGDLVEINTMIPPGASPHTFEPTSGQMKFLSEARVFVMNGLELERWATDVVRKVGNPHLVTVVAADAVPRPRLLRTEGLYDPHVWLDLNLAVYEVNAIRDAFIRVDPAHREQYITNTAAYVGKLEALDREVEARTSRFRKKEFIVFHPAWAYFAARYGLKQEGAIEVLPGKEPSAQDIAKLVDEIRKLGIPVVFTEPQFSSKAAEVIAREAGSGVVVRKLDPLGNPGNPEVSDYIKLIKHDVAVMEEVML